MADPTGVATINTTYAGQLATPFVAPAILSADTIANGYISVLENVRHKAVLKKFSGGKIADRTCEFTLPSSGQLALSDVTLTTSQLQVNEQLCNYKLAQDWAAEQMRGAYAGAPADYEAFISQYVSEITAADIENNIWAGDYSTDGGSTAAVHTSFPGILSLIVSASPSYEVSSTSAISAANVLARIAAVVALTPNSIAGGPETKLYMSRATKQFYFTALAGTSELTFHAAEAANFYNGYEIYTPAGFPNDVLLLGEVANFYFGCNVFTDETEARIIDLTNTTGDATTRVSLLFDAGVQVVDHDSYVVDRRTS